MKLQSSIVAITLALCFLATTGNAARISMSQVASYWKRAGGSTSSCPTAVAVAWAESRGDTKAKGYNSNSVDRGLWQINSYWHRDVSDSCAFDAACNAKAAVRISSGGSRWSPWATYNDGLHHRWMNDARRACGSYDEAEEGIGEDGWKVGINYKITWDQAERERKPLSLLREKVRSSNLVNRMDEEIGGGKVYGEYNKGPVKVGGEWNFDEDQENVGGGKIYGEYNKGPVKVGGEWNFDEAQENVGGEWNFDIGGPARCTNGQFKQWLVYLTGQAGAACTRPFFNACCSGCRPSKDMTKCYADCWNNKKANLNIPDICYEGRDPTDRSGKTPTFQGGRMMSRMRWNQQLAQCDAVGMSRCRWTGN